MYSNIGDHMRAVEREGVRNRQLKRSSVDSCTQGRDKPAIRIRLCALKATHMH